MKKICNIALFGATSLIAIAGAASAAAQGGGTSQPSAANSNATPGASVDNAAPDVLGEIVVTATRQISTVNKVPLSISASTQQTLDQQGVKRVDDIARTVPALNINRNGTSGDASINIRGVSSPVGAPTAGVYLDDIPLTKRAPGVGVLYGIGGPPIPQLFDLERVEVLRGPQGTLYGGSSQGGNIRFITPAPSLTRYSSYARAEVSQIDGGGTTYEGGYAIGGPLIQDKLGFRISASMRHTGGYIDHVDMYTGRTLAKDTNSGRGTVVRAAVTWAPTDNFRITPNILYSFDKVNDADTWWENIPQYTTKGTTYTNAGTINGVRYDFPDTVFPAFTDGPYNMFGPFKTGTNTYFDKTGNSTVAKSPRQTKLLTPNLVFDLDLPFMNIHNSTAYISDRGKGTLEGRFSNSTIVSNALLTVAVTGNCGQATGILDTSQCQPVRLPNFPQTYQRVDTTNNRKGFVQEIRFSSPADARPISWVAGLFYTNSSFQVLQKVRGNTEEVAVAFHGIYEPYITGVTRIGPEQLSGITDSRFKEEEGAAFGEATWHLSEELSVMGGVRFTKNRFTFRQQTAGQVTGAPPGWVGTPTTGTVTNQALLTPFPLNYAACPQSSADVTAANRASFAVAGCPYVYTNVTTKESPITPKAGISYQARPNWLFYATAAKGYRPGGVNPPVSAIVCAADFAALGISQVPEQYKSDTLWSYEGGAKLRLGKSTQINSSAFLIDWKDVQSNARLNNCGRTYTVNAAKAQIKGFDVQFETRLASFFTLSASLAYTDGKYRETVFGVGGGTVKPIIIAKGERLQQNPKWQYTIAGQINARPFDRASYLRVDYQHKDSFTNGPGPQSQGYQPFSYIQSKQDFVTARAGMTFGNVNASLFVNNVTNTRRALVRGQSGATALFTNISPRPREVGLQIIYRD